MTADCDSIQKRNVECNFFQSGSSSRSPHGQSENEYWSIRTARFLFQVVCSRDVPNPCAAYGPKRAFPSDVNNYTSLRQLTCDAPLVGILFFPVVSLKQYVSAGPPDCGRTAFEVKSLPYVNRLYSSQRRNEVNPNKQTQTRTRRARTCA